MVKHIMMNYNANCEKPNYYKERNEKTSWLILLDKSHGVNYKTKSKF